MDKANEWLSAMRLHNLNKNRAAGLVPVFIFSLIAQLGIASCSDRTAAKECNATELVENAFKKSSYYEQWRLTIYKNGKMDWNGQKIGTQEFKTYLHDMSKLSNNDGKLSLTFEEGSECQSVRSVIWIAKGSKFCKSGHCVIGTWGVKAPVVN